MSFRNLFIMLILVVSFLMGPSLAAPVIQRADDEGDSSDPSPADPVQKTMDDVPPLAINSTPAQVNVSMSTMTASPTIPVSLGLSSTPTPTGLDSQVELVPPVTVLKQLGTTAIIVASEGKTSTIQISASGLPNSTSSDSNQVASSGFGLTVSSSVIAVGLAVGAWVSL